MTFLPQRVLCLVDLSQASAAVLSWARLVAECYRAQVEVFHAAWAPEAELPGDRGDSALMFEVLGTEIEGKVNALAEAAFGADVQFRSTVVEGHPVKMVLRQLQQHPPDLIVLGSHGYDGFAQVLLGSVAENVLRVAPCPMLLVKGAALAAGVHELRTLVCAVDLGEHSQRTVLLAGDLATMLDADLRVVHVAPPGAAPAETRSRLSSWIPDRVWAAGRVHEVVLEGEAAERIVTYARQEQADLLVVTAEHRPFLEFTMLGPTTERVVRFCASSVLVVPSPRGKPEHATVEPASA